jgi:hypothetical protein
VRSKSGSQPHARVMLVKLVWPSNSARTILMGVCVRFAQSGGSLRGGPANPAGRQDSRNDGTKTRAGRGHCSPSFHGPTEGTRRPVRSAASELSRVLATTVHLVPLRADLEPTCRNGRLRALDGLAMLVIDEAETPATVNGVSACVFHLGRVVPACDSLWSRVPDSFRSAPATGPWRPRFPERPWPVCAW